jgi:hypothetical protein
MANLTRDAIDIAEGLRKIDGVEKRSGSLPPFQTFEFAGNGSKTAYEMPKGWKPLAVYDAGSRVKEASGAGFWSASFDGYIWTVTFGTAPTNLNVILVDCWRAE